MSDTCVDLLEEWQIPIWSTGFWGVRFAGITEGLLQDSLIEGAALSLSGIWLYDFRPTPADESGEQPLGSLALQGDDAMRPQYLGESDASARQRLRDKWTFWTGSPKTGILEELAGAGFGTPEITVPGDYASGSPDSDSSAAHWSRFWVIFPEGEHPITGPGEIWGDFIVGMTALGPEGLPEDYIRMLRAIVRRYKPARWVPWQFQFETPSGTIRIQARPMIDPDWVYYS